jgi:DNA-binding beta-propeller fold protein YncE
VLDYKMKPGKLVSNLVGKFKVAALPSCVTCTKDDNIITCRENQNKLLMYKADGSKMVNFQVPDGTQAWGVACTSQHVYLTDTKTGSVLMFDLQGKLIKSMSVGVQGRSCIALSGSFMYVTSRDDHKVYKLKLPDLNNKTVLLQQSDGIDEPFGVAASTTHVAVTSVEKHTVHVFNTAGKLQFQYGQKGIYGSGPCLLFMPWEVQLDSAGRVIIADYGNDRIVLLSSKGEHLGDIMLEQDSLKRPEGLCINNNGDIIVGCYNPNTIATYHYYFQWREINFLCRWKYNF